MWTKVFNKNGRVVDGGWSTFQEAITSEHQPLVMVDLLDENLKPVGDKLWTGGASSRRGELQNLVSDGNIDVDVERGTRRTGELTLLNPTSEFTPALDGFDHEGPWSGKIYLNRRIRIWRGVKVGEMELFVPVGTFMIDSTEVIIEQNMSLVNLTMSDMWKKLTKSHFGYNKTYPKGTLYNDIIRDMLDSAGVHRRGLDTLSGRDSADRKTTSPVKISRGDSRGEKLKELAKAWNIDIYADPMGVVRSEDRKEYEDKRTVWRFMSGELDAYNRNSGLISLTRSFNDDNLYNHVVIIGTGDPKNTVRAQKKDTKTKLSVNNIGDRVFIKEFEKISTQAQADAALKRIWKRRVQLSESINAEVICNPALEGDDVIRFVERDRAKVDSKYRLRRFNVPLVTSKQTVEAANIIRGEDL